MDSVLVVLCVKLAKLEQTAIKRSNNFITQKKLISKMKHSYQQQNILRFCRNTVQFRH